MLTASQMKEKVQRQRALEELPPEVWLKVEEAFSRATRDLKDFTVTLALNSDLVRYWGGITKRFRELGYIVIVSVGETPEVPTYLRISF